MKTETKQTFLESQAMLVGLEIGKWSGRKTDKSVAAEVVTMKNADDGVVSVSKRVVPSEALAKLTKITNTSRKFHKFHTVAWGDDGKRLLPVGKYEWYKNKMDDFKIEFEDLKIEFMRSYSDWRDKAKVGMGDLYNDGDYPTLDEIERMTYFDWTVNPVPSSNNLVMKLGQNQIQDIKDKIEKENNKHLEKVSTDLYNRIGEAVKLVRSRLTVNEDGKAAIIRQSVLDGLSKVAEVVPELNVMGDNNLSKLCEEVREMIDDVDATELRPHEENFDLDKRKNLELELKEMSEKMGLPI